jgi:hypothetical protein
MTDLDMFTCKVCGAHGLIVEHHYTVWEGTYWRTMCKWGPLDDDHRVQEWTDNELVETGRETDIDDDTDPSPWIDPDSQEFYVRCEGCNREIVFGWSHPDRGGRIWPIECTDYIPGKDWLEPRYQTKGSV